MCALPPGIGRLRSVSLLNLAHNKFVTLPWEIGELRLLKSLNVNNNKLTTLPHELGYLQHLAIFEFGNNPLIDELQVLARAGTTRLLQHFRARLEAESAVPFARFDEAKMLLLGPGDVGKSWLLTALQGQKPSLNQPTVGIEISRQPMTVAHPGEGGRSLQMNCWDFGGQDYYQITHQLFFSSKAIYLLVWKPRTGTDPDLVSRLERIELSAGRTAKVLIVSTHADKSVPAIIGKAALKERFGELIWGFYETDSEGGSSGTGISRLKEEIACAAAQLAGIDEPFPRAWRDAQRDIRESQTMTMTFEDFAAICETRKIDRAEAVDLAEILAVQGHAIFFADAAKDVQTGLAPADNLIILNPEWLAKAVGFVIKDEPTIAVSGLLQHSRLAQIWTENKERGCLGYDRALHGYLLWLMWKFDIAYKQSEHMSLVPEMIQRNRPDDLRWMPALRGSIEPEVTLICRIPQDPPVGLIPALTAAVHPLRRVQRPDAAVDHLDRNWRQGFFLDSAFRGTAFVELQDRDLHVVVRDKYPADLSSRIVNTLEEVRRVRWPRLIIDVRVPCMGKLDDKPCRGTFRRAWLEQRRGENIPCEDCNGNMNAEKMLEGFNVREEETMRLLRSLNLEQRALKAGQYDLMASAYHFFHQTVNPTRSELLRAPSLFSILPEEGKSWQVISNATEQRMRVTCWCEHPDGPHPGAPIGSDVPPDFVLSSPRDWLVNVAPYITWAAVLLKAFIPMAGTAVQQILGSDASIDIKDQIALMNDAAKALPTGKLTMNESADSDFGRQLKPEIVALRHIHDALLAQVPEAKRWGDLRPVTTKSGEILWLCAEHAAIQQPPVQVL